MCPPLERLSEYEGVSFVFFAVLTALVDCELLSCYSFWSPWSLVQDQAQ